MQNKNIFIAIGVLVIVGAGLWALTLAPGGAPKNTPPESAAPVPGSSATETVVGDPSVAPVASNVKEFTMTAYYDDKGKWYSLKEINVKRGEVVRIKITNTKGMHDFVITEFGIKKDLPLNEEVLVEFMPGKAGSFVYFCSMPGHREGGQWGTLTVTE